MMSQGGNNSSRRWNFMLFFCLLGATLFFMTAVSAAAPDLEAYILPAATVNNLFSAAGFTGSDNEAKFMMEVLSGLTTDQDANIRVTLPQYIVDPNTTLTCTLSGTALTEPLTLNASVSANSINAVLTVRCDLPYATTFKTDGVYTLRIDGIIFDSTAEPLSLSCNSSFVTFASANTNIVQLIDDLDDNVVGDANLCCYDNGIYYYGQNNSMQANIDVSQCSLPVGEALGLVNSTNKNRLKFYSYTIESTDNQVANQVTTLQSVVHTAVALASYNRTTGGTINEEIPSYLWYYLPQYRASLDVLTGSNWNATALNIQCALTVNDVAVTSPNALLSPNTLVRPINDQDQSQGIIVQCALGADIAANSDIKAIISGVYAPATNAGAICTLYGLTSSISACCDALYVQFRYGNAMGDDILFISTDASICPMYAESQIDADNIANSVLVSNVDFTPTQVTVNVAITNAQYSFVPVTGIAADTRYILHLPGFILSNDTDETAAVANQTNVSINIVVDGDASNIITIDDAVAYFIGTDLCFDFQINQALSANAQVVVFLPSVIPTDILPAYSQCAAAAVGGTATTDGLCCQEFTIEYVIAGVKFTSYAQTCAALAGVTVIDCDDAWGYTKCCTSNSIRIQLSDNALAQCEAYECTGDNFDVPTCCNLWQYRANARCCNSAYFCPNHCCGLIAPIAGFVEYFNEERCCDPTIADALNLEPVCNCYTYANSNDWDELHSHDCCNIDMQSELVNGTAGQTTLTPFCQCENLWDKLNPTNGNNTIDLSTQDRNWIIQNYTQAYPHFDISYCCDINDISNWWSTDAYCVCLQNYGTNTMQQSCCSYSDFANSPLCQPQTAETCPEVVEPDCGCQCGGNTDASNATISCCKYSDVNINITNISSQGETIVELGNVLTNDTATNTNNTACGCAGCVSASQTVTIIGAENLNVTNATDVESSN